MCVDYIESLGVSLKRVGHLIPKEEEEGKKQNYLHPFGVYNHYYIPLEGRFFL